MWHVIAEEKMLCSECLHRIPPGSRCLSQMPVGMPDGFRRWKYENYCITCPKCEEKGYEQSCYVRRLSHWYIHKETTGQDVSCGHCRRIVPEGTRTVAQKFYAWVEEEVESASHGTGTQSAGPATGAATAASKPTIGGWENLSNATQRKFSTAGLRGSHGIRTPRMAQRFYERSVPQPIRNAGERAILDFLKGRDASHIRSVRNSPHLAKAPSNTTWEAASKNRARGANNMTMADQKAARSANFSSAVNAGMKAVLRGAVRGGAVAAAMEAPVAGLENLFHWRLGRKTGKQATKDTAKSTAVTVGVGAATGAVVVFLPLAPAATPVVAGGLIVWAGTAVYRVARAASRDLPLPEFHVFFCKNRDCPPGFGQTMSTTRAGRLVE